MHLHLSLSYNAQIYAFVVICSLPDYSSPGRQRAVLEVAQGKRVDVDSPELTPFPCEQLSLELDILRDVCRGQEVGTIQDVVSIL